VSLSLDKEAPRLIVKTWEEPVSFTLTLDQKPTYLHATVTGVNSQENALRYLEEVRRECLARGCTRLLIEERLDGPRLRTLDVFQVASQASGDIFGAVRAIAYVDVNAENDLMEFAETVAVNRGMPVRVFPSVAEEWLRNQQGDYETLSSSFLTAMPRSSST
jgi:hypothetical protein